MSLASHLIVAISMASLSVGDARLDVAVLDAAALEAVTGAVRARMGADADVVVDDVRRTSLSKLPVVDALVGPGGKLGGPTRVVFRARRQGAHGPTLSAAGAATLVMRVAVEHAHAARATRHGVVLAAGDVVAVRHLIDRGPLSRRPTAADATGARLLRDLPADACLTSAMLSHPPAVTVGAHVVAVVQTGGIEVRAELVAVDSGDVGDRIRVMNRATRRTIHARVVSRGLVEIRHD